MARLKARTPIADGLPVQFGARRLPDLIATPPRGGWTLASASAAAWQYADEHEDDVEDVRRRTLARCAFLALVRTTPGLGRADARARLGGCPVSPGPDPRDLDDVDLDGLTSIPS